MRYRARCSRQSLTAGSLLTTCTRSLKVGQPRFPRDVVPPVLECVNCCCSIQWSTPGLSRENLVSQRSQRRRQFDSWSMAGCSCRRTALGAIASGMRQKSSRRLTNSVLGPGGSASKRTWTSGGQQSTDQWPGTVRRITHCQQLAENSTEAQQSRARAWVYGRTCINICGPVGVLDRYASVYRPMSNGANGVEALTWSGCRGWPCFVGLPSETQVTDRSSGRVAISRASPRRYGRDSTSVPRQRAA